MSKLFCCTDRMPLLFTFSTLKVGTYAVGAIFHPTRWYFNLGNHTQTVAGLVIFQMMERICSYFLVRGTFVLVHARNFL